MELHMSSLELTQQLAKQRRQFRANLRTAAKGCTLDHDARRFQYHLLQTQRYSIRLLRRSITALKENSHA